MRPQLWSFITISLIIGLVGCDSKATSTNNIIIENVGTEVAHNNFKNNQAKDKDK